MKNKGESKSILVCGGAGYIGSHCLRELRSAGYNSVVYDDFSEGHRAAVQGYEVVEGELSDTAKLVDTIARHDIGGVLHFAAFALVGVSMREPLEYYRNNITGTISLLEAMRQTSVKNIVFSSSCATYGENVPTPITEDVPQSPCNPYGESKLAVEWLLKRCDCAYKIRSVALRYFNAAGAMPDGSIGEDHLLETHLIPLVLREALQQDGKLKVFGGDYPTPDGSCVRDYIHVLDLASAHIKALEYLFDGGESTALNLGAEKGASVLEVIETARVITGIDIRHKVVDRRPGDPPELVANADKARRVLNWTPERGSLRQIVQDAWSWHKSHPKGYQDRVFLA